MTHENIAAYLQYEQSLNASENKLRRCRRVTSSLYEWLSDDKSLTKEALLAWRRSMKDLGYTPATELNYIKGINRYLDYIGRSDLRFNRGRARDISGMQFGHLTAIEPTGEKHRKDYVWRCKCQCGKEVTYPATRLLTGNTISCGCVRTENLKVYNKYIEGTSLRQSMEERVYSTRSHSGYTGVTAKRGKWQAYICYKGQNISLGSYTRLEDAVKARARGKELVQMDAMGLLDFYEELHKDDPAQPRRADIKIQHKEEKTEDQPVSLMRAKRSNNTSGYPGVHRKRSKWAARITHQKQTYHLGVFETYEEAVAARQRAEAQLTENSEQFPQWVLHSGKEVIEK